MSELNSKQKGNLTELKCLAAFVEQGITVSIPYGDCARYDFIADIEGQLYKIQCKTASYRRGDTSKISFSCRSTSTKHGQTVHHTYDESEVDFFAAYFPENDKCYLVPIQEVSCEKTLRLVPPLNNHSNVNMAEDYELEKVVKERIL